MKSRAIRESQGVILQDIPECFNQPAVISLLFSPTHRKFASSTTKKQRKKAVINRT